MDIVDEQGRLFGRINIVDAIVVLLVAAVTVAAIAVVFSLNTEEETRYVTVELSDQPIEVDHLVTTGKVTLNGVPGRITDVYQGGWGANRGTVIRIRLKGTVAEQETGGVFTVAGEEFRTGDTTHLETSRYAARGTVLSVDASDPELPVSTITTIIRGTVPESVADDIERGDTSTVAGQKVGFVESVTMTDASRANNSKVELTLKLETLDRPGGLYFGGQVVRRGAGITFATSEYEISGTVVVVR